MKVNGAGRPSADEVKKRPVRLAATKLLAMHIKACSGLSPAAIEEQLGLTKIDHADGRSNSGGVTFRRYLNGLRAMDDPQQVAELAIKKGLIPRRRPGRGGLRRDLDELLGSPIDLPLVEKIDLILQERETLNTALQTTLKALSDLQSAMSSCRTVMLGRIVGDDDDQVLEEGPDIDLESVAAALGRTILWVQAPREVVNLLPELPQKTGTNLAQLDRRTVTKTDDTRPKKTRRIKDIGVD